MTLRESCMANRAIERHRTAIVRYEHSRPVRRALADGMITPSTSVFDYGCGHGDDLRMLAATGVNCFGWDPVHRPEDPLLSADVVNLGYVVNVIEDASERRDAVRRAWALAGKMLIVSARLTAEA